MAKSESMEEIAAGVVCGLVRLKYGEDLPVKEVLPLVRIFEDYYGRKAGVNLLDISRKLGVSPGELKEGLGSELVMYWREDEHNAE